MQALVFFLWNFFFLECVREINLVLSTFVRCLASRQAAGTKGCMASTSDTGDAETDTATGI